MSKNSYFLSDYDLDTLPDIMFNKEIKVSSFEEVFFNACVRRERTYYSNGNLQCYENRNRSVEDLYRLCRFYVKDFDKSMLIKFLDFACKDLSLLCYRPFICTDIGRYVFSIRYNWITFSEVKKTVQRFYDTIELDKRETTT